MTGPQYPPGTHVKATVHGAPNVDALADEGGFITAQRMGDHSWRWHAAKHVTDVRPLVVLDPDDAEAAFGIAARYESLRNSTTTTSGRIQAALRDLAPKPIPVKPDEPDDEPRNLSDVEAEAVATLVRGGWLKLTMTDQGDAR